jgi:thiazole synthase
MSSASPRSFQPTSITVNGVVRDLPEDWSVAHLLSDVGARPEQVAVELNQRVLDRGEFSTCRLRPGDRIEIITFVGGGAETRSAKSKSVPQAAPVAPSPAPQPHDDTLVIGGVTLHSRLIVGTGKYRDFEETRRAVDASGADMVTVAVRRVNILDHKQENLLDYLDPKRYTILPNTAGCYTADDAVRTAQLARAAGVSDLVKLEVIGDPKTLFPDTSALIEAARILVKEGFVVLPYTNDDPIVAKRLEDVGCAAVMPLAAPIGSGLGVRNPYNLRIIMETVSVPVIVDAGVGTASDAAVAMELGSDGVLMNSAIAGAKDPIAMATAMRHAVLAGRLAFRAGRIEKKLYATASSPLSDLIE